MTLRVASAAALCLIGSACASQAAAPPTAAAPAAAPAPAVRDVTVTPIPGVVAEGAAWTLVWSGNETADGMVAAPDGALLFAQEQTASIVRIAPDDSASTYLTDTGFAGSLSGNTRGELLAVQRTCTDPGLPDDENCAVPTKVVVLEPERRIIAEAFADGRTMGRLNDLAADGRGGAYFTVGGVYYADPSGAVTAVVEGEGVRTNGIVLSPDGTVLYVTNGPVVLAFDVAPDGSTANRREFARLNDGDSGDGMAVDTEGRLYVTGVALRTNLYVFDPAGARLGVIPTPRQPVSVAFAGPDRSTLYLSAMGALDPDGREHTTPPGVRNTAMTVYKIALIAEGLQYRAK